MTELASLPLYLNIRGTHDQATMGRRDSTTVSMYVYYSVVMVTCMLISGASPCSIQGWEPMTTTQQISTAEIAVYGYVTEHYSMAWIPENMVTSYTTEMDIHCTFKGGPLPNRINITVGLTSCDHTDLMVGMEYITLLRVDQGTYYIDEPNYLSVAFPPTSENFYYVRQSSGVDVSDEACQDYRGNSTIPCFQTDEECNGADGLEISFTVYVLVMLLSAYVP